jgi:hypothetical protein
MYFFAIHGNTSSRSLAYTIRSLPRFLSALFPVAVVASLPLLITRVTLPSHLGSSIVALAHRELHRLLQYQCLSPPSWRITLYATHHCSARSQPPHPGSSWFHALVGDFMSSSGPERRSRPSRSSSLPGISDATIHINPQHRSVTVGRSSSDECGSRGPCISPAHNRFSPSMENAPATRPVSASGSKWSSSPSNPPPWFSGLSLEAEALLAVILIVVVVSITTFLLIVSNSPPASQGVVLVM